MAHTQGNWEQLYINTHSGGFHKIICETVSICNIITRNYEQAEANAKLISCAPEMLKAMNEFIEAVESQDIIIQENTDNDGIEAIGSYLYQSFLRITKKATL